jgi:hypothetical protein
MLKITGCPPTREQSCRELELEIQRRPTATADRRPLLTLTLTRGDSAIRHM